MTNGVGCVASLPALAVERLSSRVVVVVVDSSHGFEEEKKEGSRS